MHLVVVSVAALSAWTLLGMAARVAESPNWEADLHLLSWRRGRHSCCGFYLGGSLLAATLLLLLLLPLMPMLDEEAKDELML